METFPVAVLTSFCCEAFQRAGLTEADARTVTATLIEADLRGVETHGMYRVPMYIRRLLSGQANPRPRMSVVRETPFSILLDADNALGQLAAIRAMSMCVDKARSGGLAIAAVRHSSEFGRAAYYAALALEAALIGFATTNSVPLMAPPGGRSRVHGNNPLAFAFPTAEEPPIVLDMALSVVAGGRIGLAANEGRTIPLEWGFTDADGRPTDNPSLARGNPMPPVGGYKGYWLAMAMDVLAGILSGGPFAADIASSGNGVGHFFMALNPELFLPVDEFKRRMDEMIRQVRNAERLPNTARIYLPGERELELKAQRLREGIPLQPSIVAGLRDVAKELNIVGSIL